MSEYNFVMVKDYPIEKSANDIKLLEEYLKDAPDTPFLKFNTVALPIWIILNHYKIIFAHHRKHLSIL